METSPASAEASSDPQIIATAAASDPIISDPVAAEESTVQTVESVNVDAVPNSGELLGISEEFC